MAVHSPIYNGQVDNSGTAAPGRGLTPACFRGIDMQEKDPSYGFTIIEDFLQLPQNVLTQATAGTAALALF